MDRKSAEHMPLSIKDEETDRLARAVSAATGETIADAIKTALRQRLQAVQAAAGRDALIEKMRRISEDCAAHITEPMTSTDHADLLYGTDGLPK